MKRFSFGSLLANAGSTINKALEVGSGEYGDREARHFLKRFFFNRYVVFVMVLYCEIST